MVMPVITSFSSPSILCVRDFHRNLLFQWHFAMAYILRAQYSGMSGAVYFREAKDEPEGSMPIILAVLESEYEISSHVNENLRTVPEDGCLSTVGGPPQQLKVMKIH